MTACAAVLLCAAALFAEGSPAGLSYRPACLISELPAGALKAKLQSCAGQETRPGDFSIGHRGAALMFPEHAVQSNRAAAQMGAGILECDVTFTKDLELVCRHARNGLHTTTNILSTDPARTSMTPFTPAATAAECQGGTAGWRTTLYSGAASGAALQRLHPRRLCAKADQRIGRAVRVPGAGDVAALQPVLGIGQRALIGRGRLRQALPALPAGPRSSW